MPFLASLLDVPLIVALETPKIRTISARGRPRSTARKTRSRKSCEYGEPQVQGLAEAEASLPEYGWSHLSSCFLLSILRETKPVLLHHAKREMGGTRRLKRANMLQVDRL